MAAAYYATSMPNCPMTMDAASEAPTRWVKFPSTCAIFVPSEAAKGR